MRRRIPWRLAIGLSLIVVFVYYRFLQPSYSYHALRRSRAAVALTSSPPSNAGIAPLEIAVHWPQQESVSFIRGVHLAMTQINHSGGVRQRAEDGSQYRRRLKVRYFDSRAGGDRNMRQAAKAGMAIARRLASDIRVSAVIGHNEESIMRASVVYQDSGLLFISPTNMDRRVTLHRFGNVFRTAPRYRQVAQAMVDSIAHIVKKKVLRVAVLYPSMLRESPEDIGQQLKRHANAIIESFGDRVGFEVVFVKQYDRHNKKYREEIAPFLQWDELYDVILILDVLPDAKNLRRELEDGFARAKQDPTFEKLTLDLSSLDWTDEQAAYVDLTTNQENTDSDVSPWSNGVFEQAAALVLQETKQSAVILASRDSYGISLGAQIRSSIADTHDDPVSPLRLEMYRSFDAHTDQQAKQAKSQSYLAVAAEVLQKKPDFVFVAATGESAVNLISELREAGLDRPIICGPDLEPQLITHFELDPLLKPVRSIIDRWLHDQQHTNNAPTDEESPPENVAQMFAHLRDEYAYLGSEALVRGYVAERRGRTYVASVFDSESLSPKVTEFVTEFQGTFGFGNVDAMAAQGYQAIHLLRHAFERAGSTEPQQAAAALRLFVEEEGIFGRNRFSENGDLTGLEIVFKQRDSDGVNIIRLKTASRRQLD